MKRSILIVILVGLLAFQGCASMISPWMTNKKSISRFVPIQMWTGADWSGEKTLAMEPAETVFGSRGHKIIRGPISWTHPVTGQTLQVYERINNTRKGVKRQLFTISDDRRGLSKVYDERPNSPPRLFSTQAIMFPIGKWERGEKSTFSFVEYVKGKPVKREATIHIRRLSFTYKNVSYAIKYDYLVHDQEDAVVFHERFIYGPGKSLMYYKNRL